MAEKIISENRYLLDTGVLVALIDEHELAHRVSKEIVDKITGNIFTTEAVITEALYLLRRVKNAQNICLDYVLNDLLKLVPLEKPEMFRIKTLMAKYSDIPMSFADASMVVLAEELGIRTILTLDRRGFETYRILDSKAFNILP